jgi:hypothetical protein
MSQQQFSGLDWLASHGLEVVGSKAGTAIQQPSSEYVITKAEEYVLLGIIMGQ